MGAATGCIRTDMSEVNIQASGSSSRTIPATTSIMNAMTLARKAPWCSSSGRGSNRRRNSPSRNSARTPSRAGTEEVSLRRSVIGPQSQT